MYIVRVCVSTNGGGPTPNLSAKMFVTLKEEDWECILRGAKDGSIARSMIDSTEEIVKYIYEIEPFERDIAKWLECM